MIDTRQSGGTLGNVNDADLRADDVHQGFGR